MKKIYHSRKWKDYTEAKSQDAIDRLRKAKRRKPSWPNKPSIISIKHHSNIKKRDGYLVLSAPEDYSLINNVDETLVYFSQIDAAIAKKHKVYLDLSNVKRITTEVILYMLSRLDFNRRLFHDQISFAGNAPSDDKCKHIFLTSGFLEYMNSPYAKNVKNDPSVYSIQSDHKVLGPKAKEVTDFAKNSLGIVSDNKKIYPMIIECMGNTNNHAYKNQDQYKKWWLMASHQKDGNKVSLSFVDNGQGIPNTIRKNFREIVQTIADSITLPLFDAKARVLDSALIESALKGDFKRTRTGLSHRGNGLPWMFKNAQAQYIDDLVIISKKGYVDCGKSITRELDAVFHGTLLSWSFVNKHSESEALIL